MNNNQNNDDSIINNKLDMQSPDLVKQNIEKLAELFPNCVTESDTGKAIDFDLLKQELNHTVVEGNKERYRLEWPGKREAIVTANLPTTKTLRPVREDSVDFDNTKNIYIEGDNLEVLKLLQESYLSKIKMIYIDPPYNTGNDFVYKDNFAKDKDEELFESGQADDLSQRLIVNPETSGRYHSDWLSMMYPRLKLARNLLREDGVIFISIDDNEQGNLTRLCDEVFGEDNFVATFIWEKRTNRENRKVVSSRHDYVICYCKKQTPAIKALQQLPMSEKALANYKNPDNDPRGKWKSDPATAQAGHGTKSQFYVLEAPNGKEHTLESGRCWLYTKDVMQKQIDDGKIWFGKDGNGVPRIKTYLDAKERGLTPETILFAEDVDTNEISKNELKELFDGISTFDTPKPVNLLKTLIQMSCSEGVVLDFFSGSSSTAHALLEINAKDSCLRNFIMVQIPELCDKESEPSKAGLESIADIGKERIRRAAIKIKEETDADIDYGFRVYRLDESNMQDVYYRPQDLDQAKMDFFGDNVKPDRTEDDLLAQVMLDWGLPLSLKIEQVNITGKKVFKVAENSLFSCFDEGIDEAFAKEIAKEKPLRIVFKDSGFKDDTAKTNVKQLLKQLSPETEMKVL